MIENAHWEPLSRTCRVLVTKEHGFTTDTVLLAHFSLPRYKEICADIGTGCGTIPLLWQIKGKPSRILAVEIQENAAEQARLSVSENGFDGKIEVLRGDAREYKNLFENQSLDIISCNPPYQAAGTGIVNEDERLKLARHEESLSLYELACAARYALKYGGKLFICLKPQRLAEAISIFRENKLEPKRLRTVQLRADRAPYLFLLECRSGGKSGMTVEPVLLLEDESGRMSAEMTEIYGEYRENAGASAESKEGFHA